jgi:hypothetical protein
LPSANDGACTAEPRPVAEVASFLLPALGRPQVHALARALATHAGDADRAAPHQAHLEALAGRLLAPGGWVAGLRRAGAERWWTGRARPYDESTLRKVVRAMGAAGAVPLAEKVLLDQVHGYVGAQTVTAFTDLYDQVYWTQKDAWAGPVGGLGNRVLACTYFGLTFVRTDAGTTLALHVSWHKPAAPLLDALEALHDDPRRARWLRTHVRLHVLDRGTQGDPALTWCLAHGVPYLTLTATSVAWRRFRTPDTHTATGVPVFVREDARLDPAPRRAPAQPPTVVIFPARPAQGPSSGRALRYRTAATLTDAQLRTLDEVYKARWPSNENPIKALIAVGFDRNLDRTLDATTSRGHDGKRAKLRAKVARAECAEAAAEQVFRQELTPTATTRFLSAARSRGKALATLAAHDARPATKGARAARGAEPLCKLLTLMLFNALAWLLAKSALDAVRVLTPARVRALLLGCAATACIAPGTITLWIEATPSSKDRPLQVELLRLVNAERLRTPHGILGIRLRDPPPE